MSEDKVELAIRLDKKSVEYIRYQSGACGMTIDQAVDLAIVLNAMLLNHKLSGDTFIIRKSDGTLQQLNIEWPGLD